MLPLRGPSAFVPDRSPPLAAPAPPATGTTARVIRAHGESVYGTTVRREFGDVTISLVTGEAHEAVRPGRHIRADPSESLRVFRALAGEIHVHQDGRRGQASGPQIICCDTSRPYRLILPRPFHLVEVQLPHRHLGMSAADTAKLTATGWCGRMGAGALLSQLLAGLHDHGTEIHSAVDRVGATVAGLTAAVLADRLRHVAAEDEVARHDLMLNIQGFIRARLSDPDLTPQAVAEHHNISLRYLQRIFQEHGTSPARWIRDERLARCRSELRDPRLEHLPVGVIGERSGLYQASHFSRLFRDRYGLTPRGYRTMREAVPT
ncbi:helix-turn-helix domain-containing protein [Streptomyces sp. NPDC058401]|uniref:helix-turn-helix domain-containing protein n=1 Tax=Streptomyces sp. NPDC058401 TaxID=3346480 RepID=UPI0036685C62